MPVVPSFSGYAPKPQIAEAYLESRRANLAEQQAQFQAIQSHRQLQQQAAEAQQRLQFGQQQLQQQRAIAEMEASARAAAQQQENLRHQQQLEIDKAYKESLIGLQEGQLKQQAAMNALKVIEAARTFKAQMDYQTKFQEYGGDEEAARKAMLEVGPAGGFESGAYSSLFRAPKSTPLIPPKIIEQGGHQFGQYEEGERFYPLPQQSPDVTSRMVWSEQLNAIDDDIKRSKDLIAEFKGQGFSETLKPENDWERGQVEAFKAEQERLKELQRKREELLKSAPTRSNIAPTATGTNAPTRLRYNPQTRSLEPAR